MEAFDLNLLLTITVLALTGIVFIAFFKEWAPPDVIALCSLVLVLSIGALPASEIPKLFSNSAPITIGAMFVLSAALERTGVMDSLARLFTRLAGASPTRTLLALAAIVMPLSAFANNTPLVIVFLPILMAYSRQSGVPASKLLIPLSFFAILGGTITLIGTSTNILTAGMATSLGQRPFGIFEITGLGVIYAAAGAAYIILIGARLLPSRPTLSSLLSAEDTRSFCTQAVIGKNSRYIGRQLPDTSIGQSRTARVFEVRRKGLRVADTPIDQLRLQEGDVLILKASARDIATIQHSGDLSFEEGRESTTPDREVRLVEAIIGPNSPMRGRTIRQLGLRRRFGVVAVAVHRRGENLFERFQDVPLEFGDTVLFEGPESNLARLRDQDDFLSLNVTRERPFRKNKAPIAIAAIATVVIISALDILPITAAALAGAILVVAARCLDPAEAYASIEWPILFLIIGMLGLGRALELTGGASLLADHIVHAFGPLGPWGLLAGTYLFASLLTEVVTNNAVAVILPPIVTQIAAELSLDPRPFIVAVMFAASASFCTPIGYQTNTYVFGAGGYRFSDFARIGIPLNLLLWLLASLLIPVFWPFQP